MLYVQLKASGNCSLWVILEQPEKKNSWLLHIYTQLSYTPQKAPNSQFPNLYPIFLAKLSYCTRETKADEKMRAKTFTGGHYRCRQTNPLQHLQRWAKLGWLILSADENHPQPEKVFTERQ